MVDAIRAELFEFDELSESLTKRSAVNPSGCAKQYYQLLLPPPPPPPPLNPPPLLKPLLEDCGVDLNVEFIVSVALLIELII
jgi:hypothetical protein